MIRNTLRLWRDWRLSIFLMGIALGAGWFVRETQGGPILQIYQSIARPFEVNAAAQEQLLSARTVELQARVQELEIQNQKLQELLGFVSSQKNKGIVSPIIGRSADHWWNQVTLGRGSKEGIQVDFAVMAPGGLVGRVTSVTPDTSRVLLISDPTSRVGVGVSRTRNMGFVKGKRDGKSENPPVVEFFDNSPNIKAGDVVTTSNFSQLFPSGLPVGRIISVDMNGRTPEAILAFFAPIDSLEWVVVYPHKLLEDKPPNLPKSDKTINGNDKKDEDKKGETSGPK
jgi:rod shape-determining protein MreC